MRGRKRLLMLSELRKSLILSLYFTSSIMATLLNKLIVSSLGFGMHFLLILIQSGIVVCIIAVYYGISRRPPALDKSSRWLVTAIFLGMMILSNMKAIYHLPVSLFTLYKNLAIVPTAILEHHLFNRRITLPAAVSLALIIASSYTAHVVDRLEVAGYLWMGMNLASTTFYMVYLKHVMDSGTASKIDSVFFTNLFCLPIFGALSYALDPREPQPGSILLWALVLSSSVCVLSTAFSTAWTMEVVSSTVISVMGALNKLCLSSAGFLFFRESVSLPKITAIATGVFASFYYSYDSIKNSAQLSVPPMLATQGGR